MIKILSEDGQIPYDENQVQEIAKSTFKNEQELKTGDRVQLKDVKTGELFAGTITEIKEEQCVVDFNHPLAGKNLEFDIEVLNVD